MAMEYRRLGNAGLKVSALSLGSWVTYGPQVNVDSAAGIIKVAYDGGVNFFDNAEAYAAGSGHEQPMKSSHSRTGLSIIWKWNTEGSGTLDSRSPPFRSAHGSPTAPK